MKQVGFLYNCSLKKNPRGRLSPSVWNRLALIDASLREVDMRLFLYSPKHIVSLSKRIPGYLVENDQLLPTTSQIPAVNGNWTYRTRKLLERGMGYQRFVTWAEQHDIGIYVPHAFSELIVNKHETYKVVRGYRDDLHPYCERYRHSARQLEHFAALGRLTFIKPRAGSRGNRIVTMKRDADGLSLTYYADGVQKRATRNTESAAVDFIKGLTRGSSSYLIQRGIETLPHDESVFDIRVLMVHDGQRWDWIHEARLSPGGSDLSNVSQGGVSVVTEDLLFDLLGSEAAQQMLQEIRNESFGLVMHLDRLHPGDLMEVAFDFVLDREAKLHLVEINTKPGLATIGALRTTYDMQPEHEPFFQRWVYPHTSAVARFLGNKMLQIEAR